MGEERETHADYPETPAWYSWVFRHPVVLFLPLAPVLYASLLLGLRLIHDAPLALAVAVIAGSGFIGALRYIRGQHGIRLLVALVLAMGLAIVAFLVGFMPAFMAALQWLDSGQTLVRPSLVYGAFGILIGCTAIWVGVRLARGGRVMEQSENGRQVVRRVSLIEALLSALMMFCPGVAFISLALITLVHNEGRIVTIPLGRSLLDTALSVAFFAGLVGFLALGLAYVYVSRRSDENWWRDHPVCEAQEDANAT